MSRHLTFAAPKPSSYDEFFVIKTIKTFNKAVIFLKKGAPTIIRETLISISPNTVYWENRINKWISAFSHGSCQILSLSNESLICSERFIARTRPLGRGTIFAPISGLSQSRTNYKDHFVSPLRPAQFRSQPIKLK